MATPVTMPMLGLTMEEGTVAEWLKREGESVAKDEALLMVEMDKGTLEVPSPAAGVLRRIVVQAGTTVPVRTLIAEIGAADEVMGAATNSNGQRLFASPRARMRARALNINLTGLHGSGPRGRIVEADVLASSPTSTTAAPEARVTATPLARKLAQEHGVAVTDLAGSGPGGRVTQDDVLRAAVQRPPAQDVQPLSRIRRITAERMAASTQAAARVTLFLEADFSEPAASAPSCNPSLLAWACPDCPGTR